MGRKRCIIVLTIQCKSKIYIYKRNKVGSTLRFEFDVQQILHSLELFTNMV